MIRKKDHTTFASEISCMCTVAAYVGSGTRGAEMPSSRSLCPDVPSRFLLRIWSRQRSYSRTLRSERYIRKSREQSIWRCDGCCTTASWIKFLLYSSEQGSRSLRLHAEKPPVHRNCWRYSAVATWQMQLLCPCSLGLWIFLERSAGLNTCSSPRAGCSHVGQKRTRSMRRSLRLLQINLGFARKTTWVRVQRGCAHLPDTEPGAGALALHMQKHCTSGSWSVCWIFEVSW